MKVRADEGAILIDGIQEPLVQPPHDFLPVEFLTIKGAGGIVELAAAVVRSPSGHSEGDEDESLYRLENLNALLWRNLRLENGHHERSKVGHVNPVDAVDPLLLIIRQAVGNHRIPGVEPVNSGLP